MVRIYLVRHAEAFGNINEVFQGHIDTEVTEKGYRQLNALSERFKNINLDSIYTSPLIRARVTAEYINKNFGYELKFNDGLIEINGGQFEGKPWSELPKLFPKQYDNWKNHTEKFEAPDGETMNQVYNRMVETMKEICSENKKKTIAVVSHGCAVKNFLCFCLGKTNAYMNELGWSDNTAVSLIEFDEKFNPKVIYMNDSSHLSAEDSTLNSSKWWRDDEKA